MHNNNFNIDKLAETAMLSLTENEKKKLASDMDKLIMFADKIKSFEYDDVKYGKRGTKNVFRADNVTPCTNRDELLRSAGETFEGYIIVPAVIGGEE